MDPFFGASAENTQNLLDAYYRFGNVEEFLRDEDIYIPFFATELENARDDLKYEFDFDGIVIELSDVACLRARLHYLFVGKCSVPTIQLHWHLLKKHLPLKEYSAAGIRALHKTYGMVLSFVDGGYFLNISGVPVDCKFPDPLFRSEIYAKAQAVTLINGVFQRFTDKLRMLSPQDLQRPSVFKNDLNNLSKMNVLEEDQEFLLRLFMQAFTEGNHDPAMRLILTLSKFGQKDKGDLNIRTLADTHGIEIVSYHVGCNISAKDPTVDVMWSRYGLQQLVGVRGNLFSVLGMSEAANFQSNLDHLEMDVEMRLKLPLHDGNCTINFLQLYAVTPHCHDLLPPKHPVSRAIATCGLHIQKHSRMISNNASRYVGHMQDLAQKCVCRIVARMEAVFRVPTIIPGILSPRDFYFEQGLDWLLEGTAMLVPFQDNEDGIGLRHVVGPVAKHLTDTLQNLLIRSTGKGGYINSWTAFQYELAIEELLFGRPVFPKSKQFSVSLGTNSTNNNSLTQRRGFLGLSPVSSASVGESPPPMETWFNDPVQKQRVLRIFSLTDTLEAAPCVIGEALVLVLLLDMHERNDRVPSAAAQSASFKGDILSEIEKHGLCFATNLRKYRENGMPWLPRCFERLPKSLDRATKVTLLSFISCVAIMQNKDFVSFKELTEMAATLPVPQKQMQKLGLLSPLLLINKPVIFRLHESIVYKVAPLPIGPKRPKVPTPPERPATPEEPDEPEIEEMVEKTEGGTIPASEAGRWTNVEMQFINVNPDFSHQEAYKLYLQECKTAKISARTLASFKRKRQRLLAMNRD